VVDSGPTSEAATADPLAPQRLVVALVRGVHGLRGAVRVEVLTDRPEARFVPGAVLYREGSDAPLTVASAEAVRDGPGWRLRFAEITSREGADTLRESYLETDVRPAADLARGEVYWHEVIGCPVRGVDDAPLGVVKDVWPRTRSTWSVTARTAHSTSPRSGHSSGSSPRAGARSS
jgi:16S rRNA processing protein RimM